MHFLYAEKWRSSITISSIRVFTGEAIMEQFIRSLPASTCKNHCFVWAVGEGVEPRLLSREKLKALGLR
jgi:hypothetical protein